MHDPFDRRIGLLGISLVKGKIKNDPNIWKEVSEFLDYLLRKNNILENAPFLYIQLAFLYGTKNNLQIRIGRIGKKYGELGVSFEFDMEILKWADQHNLELLHDIFMIGVLEAVLQVCKKYDLPSTLVLEERLKYGNIPNTIKECELYKRPKFIE